MNYLEVRGGCFFTDDAEFVTFAVPLGWCFNAGGNRCFIVSFRGGRVA